MNRSARAAVMVSAAGSAVVLIAAMVEMPSPEVRLPEMVTAKMKQSGVEHPVTAVLLNFRGYDTLLEVAVLLLALLGVLAVGVPREGQGKNSDAPAELVIQALARL